MIKRLIFVCFLLFTLGTVKAQTYCYHCTGHAIENNSNWNKVYYNYSDYIFQITYFENQLFSRNSLPMSASWNNDKYVWRTEDKGGEKTYYEYDKNMFGKWKRVSYSEGYTQFYRVSGDKNRVVFYKCFKSSTEVYYYERIPDWNCR